MLGGIAGFGIFFAASNPFVAWLGTMALMAVLVISAGRNITKFYFGCLIDRDNRYSLSRLQTILWTLMILSAYLTAVFINIRAGASDALAIAIPQELWVLMGISTASLLGSPLITNQKRDAEKKEDDAEKAAPKKPAKKKAQNAGEEEAVPAEPKVKFDGEVAMKTDPKLATWSDLFKGVTKDSQAYLDISRIQMFFFTFILIVAYGYYLGQMFLNYGEGSEPIDSLPAISAGMLALLGISHSAYLGNKAIPGRKANPEG